MPQMLDPQQIPITEEMLGAFDLASEAAIEDDGFHTKDDREIRLRAGLAAVMAIVDRDHFISPAFCEEGHPDEPVVCERSRGHQGKHQGSYDRSVAW